jgi:hypothetical protein
MIFKTISNDENAFDNLAVIRVFIGKQKIQSIKIGSTCEAMSCFNKGAPNYHRRFFPNEIAGE